MFPKIKTIDDVLAVVKDKPEIRLLEGPNGFVKLCYLITDRNTFDTPMARECRGIVFDRDGELLSRPLHKFFNVGEKPGLELETVARRTDVSAVFDKIDGSMVSHFWYGNRRWFHTKTSYDNDIVQAVERYVAKNRNLQWFLEQCEGNGMTASFEWTSPENRVVVKYDEQPNLRLLHVRNNLTGEYVTNDPSHWFHGIIASTALDERFYSRTAQRIPCDASSPLSVIFPSIQTAKDIEGCVVQFKDGDMVKIKSSWYALRHKTLSYLREREIALAAITGELDDVRALLFELEVDVQGIDEVETRVKETVMGHWHAISKLSLEFKELEKKEIALKYREDPYFGPAMAIHTGKFFDLTQWYIKNHLKTDFGLKYLISTSRLRELQG